MKSKKKTIICIFSLSLVMMTLRWMNFDDNEIKLQNYQELDLQKVYCNGQMTNFSISQIQQYVVSLGSGLNNNNKINQYLIDQKSDNLQQYYVNNYSIWIILAIVNLIGLIYGILFVVYDLNALIVYRNRNYKQKPLQRSELVYPMIVSLLLSGLSLGLSVSGSMSNGIIPQQIRESQCLMVTALQHVYGGGVKNFIGINNLNSKLKLMQSQYSQTVSQIQNQMSNTNWVNSNGDALITQANSIFTSFQSSSILNPNPAATSQYQYSYFFQYLLGPISNNQSLLYNLNISILSISRLIANLISNLSTYIAQVQADSSISSVFNTAQNINSDLINQLNLFQQKIQSILNTFDQINDVIIKGASSVFILIIILSIITIISCVIIFVFSEHKVFSKLRIWFHGLWMILTIVSLLAMLGSGAIIGFSDMIYDSCVALNYGFGNQNFMSVGIQQRLNNCMFKEQSGKYQIGLQIESQLSGLSGVTGNYFSIMDYQNVSGPNYINLISNSTNAFNSQLGLVNNYLTGLKVSLNSDYPFMNDNNPVLAIYHLNQYSDSNQQANYCSISQDFYVFNLNDCPSGYLIFSNVSMTLSYNYGSKTCIQVQQINTQYQSTCSSSYTSMINYYQSIYNFDQSSRSVYTNLVNSIQSLQTNTNSYILLINNQVNSLLSIYNTVNPFVSQFNTFITQLNCNFIYTDIQNIINNFCIGISSNINLTTALITISAFSIMLTAFLSFIFATRFDKYRPIILNKSKTLEQRKTQRLSMKAGKYLDDQQNADNQQQNNIQDDKIELTNIQQPSEMYLVQNSQYNNENKSSNFENIKDEEDQLQFDSLKDKGIN